MQLQHLFGCHVVDSHEVLRQLLSVGVRLVNNRSKHVQFGEIGHCD